MGESRSTYQFGPFRLQVDRRRLLRDGEPVALSPKALETLLALVEHRDRVLTKDELLQRIWGDTVVEEGGLTRNISVLRKALGESPDDHRYIVTVPGRGYRFVADAAVVGELAEDEPAPVPESVPGDAASAPAGAAWPWRRVAARCRRRACRRRADLRPAVAARHCHRTAADHRAGGAAAGQPVG